MNLLSREGRGQEIDRLELEFISYNIQELSLKVCYIIYISYISVDCFFSRSILSGVGLCTIQSSTFCSGTAALLPSVKN